MNERDRKTQLKRFVQECASQHKSVDRAMAEVITAKLCLSAAMGIRAEEVFARIEKTLRDYREILIMEVEERYGKPHGGPQ